MPADVTLPADLDPRARWTLETVAAAAGVRVVERGAPLLDVELDLDGAFFHLARLEEAPGAPQDEHGRFPGVRLLAAAGRGSGRRARAAVAEAIRGRRASSPRRRIPAGLASPSP